MFKDDEKNIYSNLDLATRLDLTGRLEEALQSNFITCSLITDPMGQVHLIKKLEQHLTSNNPYLLFLIQQLKNKTLDVITQTTHTGRCLGGALTPFGAAHTDHRAKTLRKKP